MFSSVLLQRQQMLGPMLELCQGSQPKEYFMTFRGPLFSRSCPTTIFLLCTSPDLLTLYPNFAVYSPKAFSRDQASESAIPCLIRLLTHLLTGSTCLSSPLLKAKLCCSPSLCPYGSIQVNRLT